MARGDEKRRRIQNPIPEKKGEYSMSSSCICSYKDCLFVRRHIRQMPIKILAVPQITFPVSSGKKLEAGDRTSSRRRREREISPLSIAQRRKGGFTFEKSRSFLVGGHIFFNTGFFLKIIYGEIGQISLFELLCLVGGVLETVKSVSDGFRRRRRRGTYCVYPTNQP